jgi:hypothetical protein
MVIAPIGLFAQSNTFISTAGIFKSDVDKSLSVIDFSEIQGGIAYGMLDNSYLNLGFGDHFGGLYLAAGYKGNIFGNWAWNSQSTDTQYILDATQAIVGTTQNTGSEPSDSSGHWNWFSLLVGFGTIGINPGIWETTNTQSDTYVPSFTFTSGSGWDDVTSVIDPGTTGNNSVSQTTDASGNVIAETSTTYDNGTWVPVVNGSGDLQNVISPWINVGMDLSLGSLVLKPSLGFSARFVNGTASAGVTTYTTQIGNNLPAYQSINDVKSYHQKSATYSGGYTDLNGGVGATLILGSSSPSQMEFSIGYVLQSLPLYNNAYTDLDGNAATAAGEVWTYSETNYTADPLNLSTTTTTTDAIEITTHSYSQQMVSPGFLMRTKVSEAFSFGFSFLPTVQFSNSTLATTESERQTTAYRYNPDTVTYGLSGDYTEVENKTLVGNTVSVSKLTVKLPLNAGLQYYMIPSILRLNGGVTVDLPTYTYSLTTTTNSGLNTDQSVKTYADGTIDTNYSDSLSWRGGWTSQNGSSIFDNATLDVSLGGTWFITPAVTLDLLFAANAVQYIPIYEFTVQLNVKL